MKSAAVIGTVVGFILGALLGAVGMATYGNTTKPTGAEASSQAGGPAGAGEAPGGRAGPPGGRAGPRGGGAGSRGPSAKQRLASLVVKLDLLTDPRKPLSLELTPEQKAAIREQLQGVADPEDLSNQEADKRLSAILGGVLGKDKPLLESTGFLWPGEGPEGPPQAPGAPRPPRNPFHDKATGQHLKSLEARLGKDKNAS